MQKRGLTHLGSVRTFWTGLMAGEDGEKNAEGGQGVAKADRRLGEARESVEGCRNSCFGVKMIVLGAEWV